jgi:flavin-dependent dehydrogenase
VSANVAVVGAGPAGVVAAIACARKGMQVTLL